MTVSTPQKLAYQKAYNAEPKNVAKRVKNNQARAELVKEGRVKVGDGKDVDHKTPLDNGGGNAPKNLRVTTEATNRGWRKGQSGYNPGLQKK